MSETKIVKEENNVAWEYWIDPYHNDDIKHIEENISNKLEKGDFEEEEDIKFFEKPIQTILTPWGVLPLTEQSLASKHFKLWVGHTNFKLKKWHGPVISKCLGVEAFDFQTNYRFRIAVGKMFKDNEVMNRVRETLLEMVNANESKKPSI